MTSPQKVRSQRSEVRRQRSEVGGENLGSVIEEAYSGGVAAHGDLSLTLEDFYGRLNSIMTKHLGDGDVEQEAVKFVAGLRTDDLYLAAACAHNKSACAWSRLAALYYDHINNVAASVCSSYQEARELASALIGHLFLPDRAGSKRIASYEGRGSLATWLASIIRHQAINQRQLKSAESVPLDTLCQTPGAQGASDFEAVLLESKYGEAIVDSFKWAAEQLGERERLVLVLRVADEMAGNQIAEMLGVHRAQISRTAKRAEHKMRMTLLARLNTRHRLGREEMQECVAQIFQSRKASLLQFLRAS